VPGSGTRHRRRQGAVHDDGHGRPRARAALGGGEAAPAWPSGGVAAVPCSNNAHPEPEGTKQPTEMTTRHPAPLIGRPAGRPAGRRALHCIVRKRKG
jgi:hypothetical protein